MGMERHVKLFRNGRNQAVRIPREFELPGKDAVMRKRGKKLIIEAKPRKRASRATPSPARSSLADFLRSLKPTKERLPEIDDPPPEPVDL
jgi:antitoxin VapB